jgi:hypothetical protein
MGKPEDKKKNKNLNTSKNYNVTERDKTSVNNVQNYSQEPPKKSPRAWGDYAKSADEMQERAMEDRYLENKAYAKAASITAAIESKKKEKNLTEGLKKDSARFANSMKKIGATLDTSTVEDYKKNMRRGSNFDNFMRNFYSSKR